jgi:hypothetical protein
MQNSRLFELLSVATNTDLKEIGRCVESPIFNRQASVSVLWGYLYRCIQTQMPPDKAQACQCIWPDEAVTDVRLRNTMTRLLGVVESFYMLKYVQNQPVNAYINMVKEFRQTNLVRQADFYLKTVEEIHEGSPFRDAKYYYNAFLIASEKFAWLTQQNRMPATNLQNSSDHLDLFFLAQKLRQACIATSHSTIQTTNYDHGLLEKTLEYLSTSHYLEVPAIGIYYWGYKAITNLEDDAAYSHFKTILLEKNTIFEVSEQRDLFLMAANYCIRKKNMGNKSFAKEALEIYRNGLSAGVLLSDGLISRFTYTNIIVLAIIEKEYDWAEGFIHKYSDVLVEQHKAQIKSYNLAKLEFARGHYDSSLQYLQSAEYKDLLFNLSVKTLAMKIYFETKAIDTLYAHIDAMRNFIRRHKELGYHADIFKNTLVFLRRIVNLSPSDTEKRLLIRQQIQETTKIAEKEWLLSKL